MENNKIHIIDIELVKDLMDSKGINERELAKLMDVTYLTLTQLLCLIEFVFYSYLNSC